MSNKFLRYLWGLSRVMTIQNDGEYIVVGGVPYLLSGSAKLPSRSLANMTPYVGSLDISFLLPRNLGPVLALFTRLVKRRLFDQSKLVWWVE